MNLHSAKSPTMAKILVKIKETPNPEQNHSIIELVCQYLKRHKQDHTPFDAIRWIKIMGENHEHQTSNENNVHLISKHPTINHFGLLAFLKSQNIPSKIAQKHLAEMEIYYPIYEKHYFVLGFAHENDGFVIASPLINGWLGKHSISFVRGQNPKSESIHVFYDFWDFLSLLSHLKTTNLNTDAIILNSYDCVPQIKAYLFQYGYQKVYTWLGNDKLGSDATRLLNISFRQEIKLIHIRMNAFYQPHKHLKDWFREQINGR